MESKVFVTRRLPDDAWQRLFDFCQPESWFADTVVPRQILMEKITDKEGLVCLLTDRIDAELMDSAPQLRVISQVAVGYDNIDTSAAQERGIVVGNTPGVLTETTADFAFTLMMAAARRIVAGVDYVRTGRWQTWGLTTLLGRDIFGATLGIVGLGRIGAAVARRAAGFNMRLLYYDQVRRPAVEEELGIEYASWNRLLGEVDFLSLHVSLTPQTRGMIGAAEFDNLKSTCILINTARGPVVDTEALVAALREGWIAGAALDVTDPEPLPADHELLRLPNVIITPHIASASAVTRRRMAFMAVDNLRAGLECRPLPYPVR